MRAYRKVEDHYEFRIDGGRLALIGVGVSLVLLLVFLLGVLVGKGLWGGRRPVPIPLAEPRVEARREVPKPEGPSDKRRPELTFYDDLKRPDRPPARDQEPAPAQPSADSEGSLAAGTKSAGTAPEDSAPETAPPETAPPETPHVKTQEEASKPVAQPKPKPRPELPAPVFTVQVGSFRERTAAEDLARKMATQSVSAEVIQASVAGRIWFRVQVGRFETRAKAERHYRSQVKSKGIQGFVTTR